MRAQAPQIAPAGTDAELVRRARGRDEAAIRLILQANNRRLYRIARGILRDESEAEDVVQETYVRAFTQLDDFRGDSSLATWLARIAMNEALGRLRRRRPGVEWSSLPPGALEAQVIQFPHRPHPRTLKNPWHNVKFSMSSNMRSTNSPTLFASSSSPA
jgi:RNA polymerase sigma-70 factor (ECF subfamily)